MSTSPTLHFALVAALVAFAGCQDDKPTAKRGKAQTGIANSFEPGELNQKELAEIVARVGDNVITMADFENRLAQLNPFARGRYDSVERKREFLESMIRLELLALEAEDKGYGDDPEVVLARKHAMVKRLQAKEIRNLVRLADITDDDIQKYFEEQPDQFNKPAQVRAAHLMVADEGRAKTLLAEIQQKIAADPRKAREIFGDYVRNYSEDDATRETGGDLHFFGKPGQDPVERSPLAPEVAPALTRAAYELDGVGDVAAAIVRTPQGWHLVQKTGFRRPVERKLDDVRTSIRNKLFRKRKSEAMEKYVADLREKTKIEIDDSVIERADAARGRGANAPDAPLDPPNLRPDLPMLDFNKPRTGPPRARGLQNSGPAPKSLQRLIAPQPSKLQLAPPTQP